MKIELRKFATGFMFGVLAILALTAMYGPTRWHVLTTFTILAAYVTGRALETYGRQR